MSKLPFFVLFMCLFAQAGLYGQLFVQDFSSSTNVASYVSATPNNMQFTYVASSGAGVAVSIASGTLQYVRTSGNAGTFVRSTNFSPTPGLVKAVFDLAVPTVTASNITAAIVRFGAGYINNGTPPANVNTRSRLGINLVTGGGFQLRDIGTMANSGTFTGSHTVSWWMNNTGTTAEYIAPDGSTQMLDNGADDVWVDNALVFDEMAAVTAGVALSNFQMNFDGGGGTLRFDNFLITTEVSLPVELTRFETTLRRAQAHLSWTTASETDNAYFAVERSTDGTRFFEIARVAGMGTTRETHDYAYVDRNPEPGANYYRLRQIDFDGKSSFSPVRVLRLEALAEVHLFPSPVVDVLQIEWAIPAGSDMHWELCAVDGRLLESGSFPAESPEGRLSVGHLPPGMYHLSLNDGRRTSSKLFVKQ